MKYIIIGLGIYGSNLALDLTAQGHEVIGADNRQANIDAIKDYISTVYLVDSTEESALAVLPLRGVDVVIVAIGENFGASVKTVAILRSMGVKNIYARAIDRLHRSILEGFSIQRILTPEQRAAEDLTNEISLGIPLVESMRIDDERYVLKFDAPEALVGLKYKDLDLGGSELKLIAVSRPSEYTNMLGVKGKRMSPLKVPGEDENQTVAVGDKLLVLGTSKAYRKLFKELRTIGK